EDGPTLWLNGAVHGDELNGFMAIRRLTEALDPGKLKGALICTPLCNPLAVQWRNKVGPYDQLDLDQQFPGDPTGLISQRVASVLFREIKEKADYLINFHTAGTQYNASPYTVYKKVSGARPEVSEETQALAKAFGLATNCLVDLASAKGELPGNIAGALDVSCILQGIPAFMAEVGTGGKFEEENIALAERGIRNVMKRLGMIPGEMELPPQQIVITRRRFRYGNHGGFWVAETKPGEILVKGQTIGRIVDLFSEVEVIEAQEETFMIQVRVNPVVHTGDRVAFLGLEWSSF
ncbi:MAG: M14 family metallopeptidase, partial [Deltaproteobacteria bacterium]|nr:M14 family metallopeptidase [Deltaproteobacteria bacterium]